VMGPSGTVLFQTSETYDTPGTKTVLVDNDGSAFADQEYVVNAYVGADAYLADSLQLVVGDVQLPTPEEQTVPESAALPAQQFATAQPAAPSEAASTGGDVPGGPSTGVLALAVVGIVALIGIVMWAAWSATRRT